MKKYYVNYDEVSEEEFYEQLEGCVDSYASSIMDEAKCELEKHGYYEISIERFEIEEEEE